MRLLAIAAALVGAAPAPADTHSADRIRAHIEFLASDLLEGRDTGSRGHEIAANYVASEFRQLGLTPGGEKGSWFLRVPFRKATLSGTPTISLSVGGKTSTLAAGKDAAVRPSLTQKDVAVAAPLVFVGRGVSDRRVGIDDYAGLDVRGKIAVGLAESAPGIASDIASHLRSIQAETAVAHGAVGFISIDDPVSASGDVQRFATRPVVDWVDAQGQTGRSGAGGVAIALSSPTAEKLFQGAPMSLQQVRSLANQNKPVRGFNLNARLSVAAKSDWHDFTSPEVVAVLPGSDPKLAAEHIVLMGHLDHLGVNASAKSGEDAIYNGALDNAAGVATLIEAAREFVQSGKPPRRSVMFIANTGEELGLRGADYFSAHPTVPAERIVGLVDLDMPLLLYDFTDVVAFGFEHSTIAKAVAEAGKGMNVAVSPDPMPDETLFVRSDHYPFVKRGVPAVFLMTGWANGGKPIWQRWLANTYHTAKDDVSQPIDWRAGARFAELNYRIARTMADADQRPMWYSGDYFGDTFAPNQPKAKR
nr:M20/M25/M40 family metallo-hydrolase [Sphingomonas telluris]